MRILAIIFFLYNGIGFAQKPLPYFRNYSSAEFQAHPLMWGMAQDKNHVLYFANNDGVVAFNGGEWKTLRTPADARSVAIDAESRLFVGCKGDFGWFRPTKEGGLEYFSFRTLLPEKEQNITEVQKVYCGSKVTYFLADNKVITAEWSGEKYLLGIYPIQDIYGHGVMSDALYLNSEKQGLCKFDKGKLYPTNGGGIFKDKEIVSIIQQANKDAIIVTANNGIYQASGGEYRATRTNADKYLDQNIAYDASLMKNGNIAIATKYGGVVIVNLNEGSAEAYFNKANGFPSDEMYTIFSDLSGGVWATHATGVSYILSDPGLSTFVGLPGLKGKVNALATLDGKLYVTTISGVFTLGGGEFKPIQTLKTEAWSLLEVSGRMIVATNLGVYDITGGNATPIIPEQLALSITPAKEENSAYVGLGAGLRKISYNGKWEVLEPIKDFDDEVNSVYEDDKFVWIGTNNRGLARFANGSETVQRFRAKEGLTDGYVKVVPTPSKTLLFQTREKVLRNDGNAFKLDEEYTKLLYDADNKFQFTGGKLFLLTEEGVAGVNESGGKVTLDKALLCNAVSEQIGSVYVDGSNMWVATFDQVFSASPISATNPASYLPNLSRVVVGTDSSFFKGFYWDDDLKFNQTQTDLFKPAFDYAHNSVTFIIGSSDFRNPKGVRFVYRMIGLSDEWSEPVKDSKITFNNIREGSYRFEYKVISPLGKESEVAAFDFSISPPWYRSILAWVFYLAALIGVIYVIIKFNQRRLLVQNKKLEETVEERTREIKQKNEALETAQKELITKNTEIEKAYQDLQTTQDQLVQSEKMAALGQLIAGVAHEINTPIGAINASAGHISRVLPELIQKELPPLFKSFEPEYEELFFRLVDKTLSFTGTLTSREERQYRKEVTESLESMGVKGAPELAKVLIKIGVFDGLEEFRKLFEHPNSTKILEAASTIGKIRMHVDYITLGVQKTQKIVFALKSYSHKQVAEDPVIGDLHENIESVLVIYGNQLKYGVEVTKHFDRSIPPFKCFPDQLTQVWTNVIHNAVQAMDGKGAIDITTVKEGGFAITKITDSGPGIPPEVQPRIFEAFFTTKKQGEGSGLGLDICKKIVVEKHGGDMWFESEPGKTTFFVKLPIA